MPTGSLLPQEYCCCGIQLASPTRLLKRSGTSDYRTWRRGDYTIYAWDDPNAVEYADQDWMRRYGGGGLVVTPSPRARSSRSNLTEQLVPLTEWPSWGRIGLPAHQNNPSLPSSIRIHFERAYLRALRSRHSSMTSRMASMPHANGPLRAAMGNDQASAGTMPNGL